MELTQEQKQAHDKIIAWVASGNKLLTLGGYAGVGKTTLVGRLAETLKVFNKKIAFCAISGKASTVLKSKLTNILTENDYCGTVHSLIYRLIGKEKLKSGRHELYFGVRDEIHLPYDLIILDEASMVSEYVFKDLAALGIPILAVGDHGQLPPVKGNFNLMEDPQIRLETIMRQAEGNSIIAVSKRARETGVIDYGDWPPNVSKTRDSSVFHGHDFKSTDSVMLCAINKTRVRMNTFARDKLGLVDPSPGPVVGEPLICLYNNHRKMIYNGNIGILEKINDHKFTEGGVEVLDVEINMGDFVFSGCIDVSQFGKPYTNVEDKEDDVDYFDWGYCITVHKSQGSEWKNVLLIEEGQFMFRDSMWNRWIYTGVTRARENLIIYKR